MTRAKKTVRTYEPTINTTTDRHPYIPTGELELSEHTRIAWNKDSAWVLLDGDHILADSWFFGELLTPLQALALADQLTLVCRKMGQGTRTSTKPMRKPGQNYTVEEQCEGLASIGLRREEAVICEGWMRTCAKPLDREQLRTLARLIRTWASAENRRQERLEMMINGASGKKQTRRIRGVVVEEG